MKKELADCLRQVTAAIDAYPWLDRRRYGDWLAQTYYYVRHSTRLLAAAAARFEFTERGDAMHHRFGAHFGEEKKHELLALHDLKSLGFTLEQFPERPLTRAFYEAQYFKVEHLHPASLLGYILLLEGVAVSRGRWISERVETAFGKGCATFVNVHAADDPDHIEKALEQVQALDEMPRALVEQNLLQSTELYTAMLASLRAGT